MTSRTVHRLRVPIYLAASLATAIVMQVSFKGGF